MKKGDKLPVQIQGINVGFAEVKEVRTSESEVDLLIEGMHVTMGLAQSLTDGPQREPERQVIVSTEPEVQLDETVTPEVKPTDGGGDGQPSNEPVVTQPATPAPVEVETPTGAESTGQPTE